MAHVSTYDGKIPDTEGTTVHTPLALHVYG